MSDAGRSSRRVFLKSSAACVGGAFALCSLLPESLRALPVDTIAGLDGAGEVSFPIPPADSINVDGKTGMILARTAGKVYVFSMTCPHERAGVKWVPKDNRFACTKHDSKYRPDGTYISGRSTRSLDRFPIRRDGNNVLVNPDLVFRADKDPAGWAAAVVSV
ncbi:MAG: Rieske (2Fe-2S) protein [Acidobacteria bacterium]|nr:MAG: Rieske (2Fe-2S) protein [Acidobacteriota bacterium]